MKKVIIIGAGAHGAEIEEYIFENNFINPEIEILGFLDDSFENYNKSQLRFPLLGGVFTYSIPGDVELIIAISSVAFRFKIIEHFNSQNIKFTNFIHHNAKVFRTAKLGNGNIICPFTQIGPNVQIGDFNTFNNKASIGHDSIIGNNNVFCPNIGLSGNTKVGNSNFFSLNVATIPSVTIGDNNIIAPNMVIEKNIKNDSTFFHRYKEVVLVIPKQ